MGMIAMLFVAEVFSTVLQRIFCDNILEKREGSWRNDLLSWGAYFVLFNAISCVITDYAGIAWINTLIFMIAFFSTIRIRYRNANRTLIAVTLFMYLSGKGAELLTYYGYELLSWRQIGERDVFCIAVSKITWFLLIKIASQIVKLSKKMDSTLQDWLEVFVVPTGSIWFLLSLFIAGALENSVWGFLSVSMIMLINIFTYYLYDKAKENTEKRIKKEILIQRYAYNIGKDRENKEWWEQIRRFQHDMKQRYIVEKAFLEKKDYAALEKYCDENIDFLCKKNNVADTGNIYVDSIINYKANLAERENIHFVTDISIPSDVELNAGDFCICMGNLLDNAIEAVMDLSDKRVIYIRMNVDNNNMFINVKNRYKDKRQKEGGQYRTSKQNKKNHGLGMLSIRQIVKKYDGQMVIRDEDGQFDVMVVMYDFLKY